MPAVLDCLAIEFSGFVMCDVNHVFMVLYLHCGRLLMAIDLLVAIGLRGQFVWTG